MNNWLKGKKVLITGATSGVGKALSLLLNEQGSIVIANGRSEEDLKSLIEIAKNYNLNTILADLRHKEGCKTVEAAIHEQQPEVLVLNAGYNCGKELSSDWTDDEIYDMLQVNLISAMLCARTFLKLPQLPFPRRLVLILSTSCFFARPKMSLYITAKMGLMGFGKALQQEAHELGTRTLLLYPGRINSGFRKIPNPDYMKPESVAQSIISILNLPDDVVPYEFTFRPEIDTYI
jgi:short-subunit dehydrogenase